MQWLTSVLERLPTRLNNQIDRCCHSRTLHFCNFFLYVRWQDAHNKNV
ncbi:hypothetical protein [Undibacterium sp. KW1]